MIPNLDAHEITLVGEWLLEDGKVVGSAVADRINYLIENYLVQVAHREGGWTKLFRDPADGRFWELSYPQSQLHGGGPPRLDVLSIASVRELYGAAVEI